MPVIACPHCGTKLNAPEGVLGKEVICGQCRQRFTAVEQPMDAAPTPTPIPSPSSQETPGQVPEDDAPESMESVVGPSDQPMGGQDAVGGQKPSPPAVPSEAPAPPFSQDQAGAVNAMPHPVAPPPAPPVQGYGMPGYYAPPLLPTSGFAIASLILGIASILTCFCYGLPSIICGPLALVFGSRARQDINEGRVAPSSAGLVTAGKICGTIGLVFGVGYLLFMIVLLSGGMVIH